MFTDNPTIPAQLEVLLEVVYASRHRRSDADALRQLMQPKGLPDLTESSRQSALHLSAAQELGLVHVDDDGNVKLSYPVRGGHHAMSAILTAFDRVALADASVEKWAGRFYAYLTVNETVASSTADDIDRLTHQFMADLAQAVDNGNAMNKDKYRALVRWYVYVGLGWFDPASNFVPDPTDRIRRSLHLIWGKDRRLESDEFMERLGRTCPELDGGALFAESTSRYYNASARQCTQAVAGALRRLHGEGDLSLHCPSDSKGWSIDRGGSNPVPGEASTRIDFVERARLQE